MNRRRRLLSPRSQVGLAFGGATVAAPALGPTAFAQPQVGAGSVMLDLPMALPAQTSVVGPFAVEWCTTENDGVLFEDHAPFWRVTNSEAYVRASGWSMTWRTLADISEGSLVWRDSYFSPDWYVLTPPQSPTPAPGSPTPPAGSVPSKASSGSGVALGLLAVGAVLLGGES